MRRVTGTGAYMVNAKVGAPFGNNAKQVTCKLIAVENNSATTLDSSETLWIGNNTTTAKGVIALGGLYLPNGGAAAGVDIVMQCFTGGDSRTLTRGVLNVVGVNAVN
jgi:hypothetical protein